jgi:hypothetical protein
MTSKRIIAATVLVAAAIAAPAAAAQTQTYIWDGHGYTQHPPSTLRLGRVRLTNIAWDGGNSSTSGAWGVPGEPNSALVWPNHWYRATMEIDSFDMCVGGLRQYALTVSVWLPPHIPNSPLVTPGRARERKFALPVPAC